ncbi:transcriptional repressor, partial [Clydaea vesicula]
MIKETIIPTIDQQSEIENRKKYVLEEQKKILLIQKEFEKTDSKMALTKKMESYKIVQIIDGKKRFACTFFGCEKTFTTSGHVARHLRIHNQIKPFACPIEECNSIFARHDNMKQHHKAHLKRLQNCKNEKIFSKPKVLKKFITRTEDTSLVSENTPQEQNLRLTIEVPKEEPYQLRLLDLNQTPTQNIEYNGNQFPSPISLDFNHNNSYDQLNQANCNGKFDSQGACESQQYYTPVVPYFCNKGITSSPLHETSHFNNISTTAIYKPEILDPLNGCFAETQANRNVYNNQPSPPLGNFHCLTSSPSQFEVGRNSTEGSLLIRPNSCAEFSTVRQASYHDSPIIPHYLGTPISPQYQQLPLLQDSEFNPSQNFQCFPQQYILNNEGND